MLLNQILIRNFRTGNYNRKEEHHVNYKHYIISSAKQKIHLWMTGTQICSKVHLKNIKNKACESKSRFQFSLAMRREPFRIKTNISGINIENDLLLLTHFLTFN